VRHVGAQLARPPVEDGYLDRSVRLVADDPAGDLHRGARVQHGVGDKLAGQQDRVVHERVLIRRPAGQLP